MTNEQIKNEVDQMYAQIKDAQERLYKLRNLCNHEETAEGAYSYRVGVIQTAEICKNCGEVVRIKDFNI